MRKPTTFKHPQQTVLRPQNMPTPAINSSNYKNYFAKAMGLFLLTINLIQAPHLDYVETLTDQIKATEERIQQAAEECKKKTRVLEELIQAMESAVSAINTKAIEERMKQIAYLIKTWKKEDREKEDSETEDWETEDWETVKPNRIQGFIKADLEQLRSEQLRQLAQLELAQLEEDAAILRQTLNDLDIQRTYQSFDEEDFQRARSHTVDKITQIDAIERKLAAKRQQRATAQQANTPRDTEHLLNLEQLTQAKQAELDQALIKERRLHELENGMHQLAQLAQEAAQLSEEWNSLIEQQGAILAKKELEAQDLSTKQNSIIFYSDVFFNMRERRLTFKAAYSRLLKQQEKARKSVQAKFIELNHKLHDFKNNLNLKDPDEPTTDPAQEVLTAKKPTIQETLTTIDPFLRETEAIYNNWNEQLKQAKNLPSQDSPQFRLDIAKVSRKEKLQAIKTELNDLIILIDPNEIASNNEGAPLIQVAQKMLQQITHLEELQAIWETELLEQGKQLLNKLVQKMTEVAHNAEEQQKIQNLIIEKMHELRRLTGWQDFITHQKNPFLSDAWSTIVNQEEAIQRWQRRGRPPLIVSQATTIPVTPRTFKPALHKSTLNIPTAVGGLKLRRPPSGSLALAQKPVPPRPTLNIPTAAGGLKLRRPPSGSLALAQKPVTPRPTLNIPAAAGRLKPGIPSGSLIPTPPKALKPASLRPTLNIPTAAGRSNQKIPSGSLADATTKTTSGLSTPRISTSLTPPKNVSHPPIAKQIIPPAPTTPEPPATVARPSIAIEPSAPPRTAWTEETQPKVNINELPIPRQIKAYRKSARTIAQNINLDTSSQDLDTLKATVKNYQRLKRICKKLVLLSLTEKGLSKMNPTAENLTVEGATVKNLTVKDITEEDLNEEAKKLSKKEQAKLINILNHLQLQMLFLPILLKKALTAYQETNNEAAMEPTS